MVAASRSDAREEMIVRNLPLVSFVVGKMSGENGSSAMDREDAVAYGIEGLIQAVDSYDPTRGTTFASFAIRRIRGSILDAIRRMDVLPRSLRKGARELEKATMDLAAQLGRWPSQRELAMKLGMPLGDLQRLVGHSSSRVVSLERIMGEKTSEGASPWEASDPDEYADPAAAADRKASMMLLDSALTSLPARDRAILQLRYGRGMAFHEIGAIMELSESRVCQLHKRILSSLKGKLKVDLAAA
ncbi:MAG TPA: FliA/WhiG family RNA polymerase sigma factor [Dehalococcoidia bacterium]